MLVCFSNIPTENIRQLASCRLYSYNWSVEPGTTVRIVLMKQQVVCHPYHTSSKLALASALATTLAS